VRVRGWEIGGRNDSNNICTYKYINKEKIYQYSKNVDIFQVFKRKT
jgi:hypothetical protein